MIDPRIADIAATHLTVKQLQVFDLHHHRGWSFRAIAVHLDIARTTATDRYDNACRTLRKHGVRFTEDGQAHLEEHTTA